MRLDSFSCATLEYVLLGTYLSQVDGLTIGVGFARSTSSGVGLALACIVEEIPHQLGEFAMLVRAGMGLWRAALAKLFSSSPALLGFVCGALVGQLVNARP